MLDRLSKLATLLVKCSTASATDELLVRLFGRTSLLLFAISEGDDEVEQDRLLGEIISYVGEYEQRTVAKPAKEPGTSSLVELATALTRMNGGSSLLAVGDSVLDALSKKVKTPAQTKKTHVPPDQILLPLPPIPTVEEEPAIAEPIPEEPAVELAVEPVVPEPEEIVTPVEVVVASTEEDDKAGGTIAVLRRLMKGRYIAALRMILEKTMGTPEVVRGLRHPDIEDVDEWLGYYTPLTNRLYVEIADLRDFLKSFGLTQRGDLEATVEYWRSHGLVPTTSKRSCLQAVTLSSRYHNDMFTVIKIELEKAADVFPDMREILFPFDDFFREVFTQDSVIGDDSEQIHNKFRVWCGTKYDPVSDNSIFSKIIRRALSRLRATLPSKKPCKQLVQVSPKAALQHILHATMYARTTVGGLSYRGTGPLLGMYTPGLNRLYVSKDALEPYLRRWGYKGQVIYPELVRIGACPQDLKNPTTYSALFTPISAQKSSVVLDLKSCFELLEMDYSYMDMMFPFRRFIDECCVITRYDKDRVPTRRMRAAINKWWFGDSTMDVLSPRALGGFICSLDGIGSPRRGMKAYTGLLLKKEVPAEPRCNIRTVSAAQLVELDPIIIQEEVPEPEPVVEVLEVEVAPEPEVVVAEVEVDPVVEEEEEDTSVDSIYEKVKNKPSTTKVDKDKLLAVLTSQDKFSTLCEDITNLLDRVDQEDVVQKLLDKMNILPEGLIRCMPASITTADKNTIRNIGAYELYLGVSGYKEIKNAVLHWAHVVLHGNLQDLLDTLPNLNGSVIFVPPYVFKIALKRSADKYGAPSKELQDFLATVTDEVTWSTVRAVVNRLHI